MGSSTEAAHPLHTGCSISVYGGLLDPEVEREHLEQWQYQTAASFVLRMFDGGHFFVREAEPLVLRILANDLLPLANRRG